MKALKILVILVISFSIANVAIGEVKKHHEKLVLRALGSVQLAYMNGNEDRNYGSWQSLVDCHYIESGYTRSNLIEGYSIAVFDAGAGATKSDSKFVIIAQPNNNIDLPILGITDHQDVLEFSGTVHDFKKWLLNPKNDWFLLDNDTMWGSSRQDVRTQQQKSLRNEDKIKRLNSSSEFNLLSIPDDQREVVFGLIMQMAEITLKHSINKEVGIRFVRMSEKEALRLIQEKNYYVIDEAFETSLHFVFAKIGSATRLVPGRDLEEMEATLKKDLSSGRLTHIIKIRTRYKDLERIHSIMIFQID